MKLNGILTHAFMRNNCYSAIAFSPIKKIRKVAWRDSPDAGKCCISLEGLGILCFLCLDVGLCKVNASLGGIEVAINWQDF